MSKICPKCLNQRYDKQDFKIFRDDELFEVVIDGFLLRRFKSRAKAKAFIEDGRAKRAAKRLLG